MNIRYDPRRALFSARAHCPWRNGSPCAERLLRAVGMLHRRQILHRDIKPENLLLGTTENCEYWISVWRIAPACREDRAHVLPRHSELYRA